MATPNEKLAAALSKLREVEKNGIVRGTALTQTYRERLIKAGFLIEVIKGWYCQCNPAIKVGDTTWLAFYWEFVKQYLTERFGNEYCLSAQASLLLQAGNQNVPQQLVVLAKRGGVMKLDLPGGLSVFTYQDEQNFPASVADLNGLSVLRVAEALARVQDAFYRNNQTDAHVCLANIKDASQVLPPLLDGGKSVVAGRIAGAFRAIGRSSIADEILSTMRHAGYDSRETNPFDRPLPTLTLGRNTSPLEIRIRAMWATMREVVIEVFPESPGLPSDPAAYMKAVEANYADDAYNSLSIEGYRVSLELIEKVRGGNWNPDSNSSDRKDRDALAARGYYLAFQEVWQAIEKLIRGEPVSLVRQAHRDWYRALFGPSVESGILAASDLSGYRNNPVYINGSQYVPPPSDAVIDGMHTLFDLLEEEQEAAVRAVLGHFAFVYIHPYGDGNGRLGRFLMNAMLASGGYPWTVIKLSNRARYMQALSEASIGGDIKPFAEYVASELGTG
jgi:hypothetical protein